MTRPEPRFLLPGFTLAQRVEELTPDGEILPVMDVWDGHPWCYVSNRIDLETLVSVALQHATTPVRLGRVMQWNGLRSVYLWQGRRKLVIATGHKLAPDGATRVEVLEGVRRSLAWAWGRWGDDCFRMPPTGPSGFARRLSEEFGIRFPQATGGTGKNACDFQTGLCVQGRREVFRLGEVDADCWDLSSAYAAHYSDPIPTRWRLWLRGDRPTQDWIGWVRVELPYDWRGLWPCETVGLRYPVAGWATVLTTSDDLLPRGLNWLPIAGRLAVVDEWSDGASRFAVERAHAARSADAPASKLALSSLWGAHWQSRPYVIDRKYALGRTGLEIRGVARRFSRVPGVNGMVAVMVQERVRRRLRSALDAVGEDAAVYCSFDSIFCRQGAAPWEETPGLGGWRKDYSGPLHVFAESSYHREDTEPSSSVARLMLQPRYRSASRRVQSRVKPGRTLPYRGDREAARVTLTNAGISVDLRGQRT